MSDKDKEKDKEKEKPKVIIQWPTHVQCDACSGKGCAACNWKGSFER